MKPGHQDYEKLWEYYRQGVVAGNTGELGYGVGHRAFKNGVAQRAIALMLASSSSMVEQIHRKYRKQKAVRQLPSSRQVELD